MTDTITVRGFAATRPDLRSLPDGTPVASFRLASTPRRYDAQSGTWVDVGPTNWYTVTCFRKMAGNVASSLSVGDAVVVLGRLRLRPWTSDDGAQRVAVEIDASAVGPDLAFGTASYRRSGGARPSESAESPGHGQVSSPQSDTEDGAAGEESTWEGDAADLLVSADGPLRAAAHA